MVMEKTLGIGGRVLYADSIVQGELHDDVCKACGAPHVCVGMGDGARETLETPRH